MHVTLGIFEISKMKVICRLLTLVIFEMSKMNKEVYAQTFSNISVYYDIFANQHGTLTFYDLLCVPQIRVIVTFTYSKAYSSLLRTIPKTNKQV